MTFLSILIVSLFSWASVPRPVDSAHPGSPTYDFDYRVIDVQSLGRTSKLYLPETKANIQFPLLVLGHGQATDVTHNDKTLKHFYQRGIATLYVQYDDGFFDQDWRRMASDFNQITQDVLNNHPVIDPQSIIYTGHSKGGYVALMAAGAPNKLDVKSLVLFAPAGYDAEYLKEMNPTTPVTFVWGEKDDIVKENDVRKIYNELDVEYKQFITAVSYIDHEADHYFPLNKSIIFFGGKDGINNFHYHAVWKWIGAAVQDVFEQTNVTNPYLYGSLADSSGDKSINHLIERNFETRNEYLVKIKKNESSPFIQSLVKNQNPMLSSWYKLTLTKNDFQKVRSSNAVLTISKNIRLKPLTTPNDLKSSFWGLANDKGFDLNAVKAWEITKESPDVVIAVIDSGLKIAHSEFRNNLWVNQSEKEGQKGVDDDGNGYTDDIHGYNFAVKTGDPTDSRGHGTMVTSLIAAEGDNGTGRVGMTWKTQLMVLNMFPNFWGDAKLDYAIKAIEYAVDHGAQIINASWGQSSDSEPGDDSFAILREAIDLAQQKGIPFVAAAGNSGEDNDQKGMIPATLTNDNIISVGAMNRNGEAWSKSNFGQNNVHVFAPGEDVDVIHIKYGMWNTSGTSLSAPFITGLISLMLQKNPNLSVEEIKTALIKSCDVHPPLSNLSQCQGYVNAERALQLIE
ncbi:MAG: S8 family serine peptidase [Bdellovibrionales bacterium]|nr:S8 family serine peptidase [Bdellovibrionales bacterium]NQZ19789.1 S8 family serine peptidase [Bdellovibrionales bacterium]